MKRMPLKVKGSTWSLPSTWATKAKPQMMAVVKSMTVAVNLDLMGVGSFAWDWWRFGFGYENRVFLVVTGQVMPCFFMALRMRAAELS